MPPKRQYVRTAVYLSDILLADIRSRGDELSAITRRDLGRYYSLVHRLGEEVLGRFTAISMKRITDALSQCEPHENVNVVVAQLEQEAFLDGDWPDDLSKRIAWETLQKLTFAERTALVDALECKFRRSR